MDWLRQLPIGQYVDPGEGGRPSWLRRLDPRLKLLWTLAFLLTPILAGPFWRLGLVALLLLITLVSGLPLRLWLRGVVLWLLLASLVGLLSCVLPVGGAPPASLQRPPGELRLSAAQPAAERSGLAWEVLRLGPARLGPLQLMQRVLVLLQSVGPLVRVQQMPRVMLPVLVTMKKQVPVDWNPTTCSRCCFAKMSLTLTSAMLPMVRPLVTSNS